MLAIALTLGAQPSDTLKIKPSFYEVNDYVDENENCLKCHGETKYSYSDADWGKTLTKIMYPDLIVDRDAYYDDFINNKVYYEVQRSLREEGKSLDLPDEEVRKLGLAGGLMARIAKVDRTVTDDELKAMVSMLEEHWALTPESAAFVANVTVSSLDVNYDYYRMTREFATSTTLEERQGFLVALFVIAGADKDVSFEETEEIRLISRGINVSHKDFIDAKLKAKSNQG